MKAKIMFFSQSVPHRKPSNWTAAIAVVLICFMILSMCGRTATAQLKYYPPTLKADTTKPKTFQYFMTSKLPEYTLMVSWDSLQRIIVPQMGKTMTVDQAEYWKESFFRNAFKVYGSFRVTDSVEVKGGGK